jgi:hypothetical protein
LRPGQIMRDKGHRGSRRSWSLSLEGRQVRAKAEQLRWQCFKEEQEMPILGLWWHRVDVQPRTWSVINTRSSHPCCVVCRAGGCIEDSNLRQACLGFAYCAIPWTDGHPWRGLDSNVLPSCMRSRGCEHASMQMVQDGWVTLRLARCVADGWIGMHCDFILGPRGFGYCIIPGS